MRATLLVLFLTTAAVAVGFTALFSPRAGGNELTILCAAVLAPPLNEVRDAYQRRTGVRVTMSVDGSGALLAKMKAGAPADVYLPAERHFADEAFKTGLIEKAEPVVRLEPVVAVAHGNPKQIAGLADLLRDDVRVSLAEPDLAAVGHVTREVMTGLNLWDKFAARAKSGGLSFQGTVTKSAGDIGMGAADASVVWLPMAKPFQLETIRDPALDARNEFAFVAVTANNSRRMHALRFVHFLTTSTEAKEIFDRLDFPKACPDAKP